MLEILDKIKDKFFKKKIKKENEMAQYQGKQNNLDYTKVTAALNKCKKNNNNCTALKDTLINLKKEFERLETSEKQQELRSGKFKNLSKKVRELNDKGLSDIIESMENQIELSDNEKIIKELEEIQETLKRLEDEDITPQGQNIASILEFEDDIKKIAGVINSKYWNTLKNSIPKTDLSSITTKIQSIETKLTSYGNNVNNSSISLNKTITSLKNDIKNIKIPTPPRIPNDYLKKDDFEFIITDKLKDLKQIKESSENMETIPAKINNIETKLDNLSTKIDNLPSSNSVTTQNIPTQERAVTDLAKYMTDGIAQFENIAKEYISKIKDLENLENLKNKHQKELENIKQKSLEEGKRDGKIELIKKIAENFPTEFKFIKSVFEDFIEEKFQKYEELKITNDNQNELMSYIEEKIEANETYKVIQPALLLNNEILFKANVEQEEKLNEIAETNKDEDTQLKNNKEQNIEE